MKKPNFKKWARREVGKIKTSVDNLDTLDAYDRTARLARKLGDRYSSVGATSKASRQYRLASEAYGKLGDSENESDMLRKARGGVDISRMVGSIAGVIFLTTGFLFLSVRLTGNSISNLSSASTNLIGAVLFIFGVLTLYFSFQK
jgi:hypothetical protein